MALEVQRKNNSVLLIHYYPEYLPIIFAFGLWLFLVVFFLFRIAILSVPPIFIVLSLPGVLITILFVVLVVATLKERELRCAINRKTGMIIYKKLGILGSQYGVQKMQDSVTEIIALDLERYAIRGQDVFQIRLALTGNRILPLSSANLDFYECQTCANLIHQFLGVDIPLRAID